MKRFLPLLIAFIFTAVTFLAGCSDGEVNRSEELKEVLETARSNLGTALPEETCEYEQVSDYLKTWAEGCGVKVEKSAKHYTVLFNPATKGQSKKKTTILQCGVRTDSIKSDLNALAMGLTCLLGPNKHDNIRLIVTEINEGRYIGASGIDSRYLHSTDFINLSTSRDYSLYVSGAEAAKAVIKTKAKRTAPKYKSAYKLTLSFDQYADPFRFDKHKNYPDPITVIGNLLATAKSSGRLFEIASFNSHAKAGYMPYKATAVIVIDGNNVEGFMKKFDSSFKTMEDRFASLECEFEYTMEETDMPDSVLSDETANGLISLMYTLNTGICSQDEDTGLIHAASYMDAVRTENNVKVSLQMRARSIDDLQALSTDYETTSGLCNMHYSCTEAHPVWTSSDDQGLASYFSNLVPLAEDESNIMLSSSELDRFAAKNKNLNAISYSFVKDASKNTLRNIINYMDRSE